jgi:transcriptional regulator with XRE-family HTH domain
MTIETPELKIKRVRELKNISQKFVADQLNISLRAYYKIETGKTQLTINRLNAISKILGVPAMEILQFNPEVFLYKP